MGTSSPGFTLIELVTMIVALSILALSFAPIDNSTAFNLEMATQRVEQELRFAKELASTANVNHGIYFVAYGDYTVYRETQDTPVDNPLTRAPLIVNISDEFSGIHIPADAQIEFNALGQLTIGDGEYIRLETDDFASAYYIYLNPVTGAIQRVDPCYIGNAYIPGC